MYREYQYTNVVSTASTGSTATMLVGRGFLHAITKNIASGDVIRICDTASTSSTTANVGLIASGNAAGTYLYDVVVANGLKVDVGLGSDITVSWCK